ncbi:uncharacterized protein LOC141911991 [Tubulanus polymorphus]|uniref:uncharacterized protein LOC141911991 n=1 Tax=Tubulanus polymorphus TaxID=672921 RepID=UPI003DA4B1F0
MTEMEEMMVDDGQTRVEQQPHHQKRPRPPNTGGSGSDIIMMKRAKCGGSSEECEPEIPTDEAFQPIQPTEIDDAAPITTTKRRPWFRQTERGASLHELPVEPDVRLALHGSKLQKLLRERELPVCCPSDGEDENLSTSQDANVFGARVDGTRPKRPRRNAKTDGKKFEGDDDDDDDDKKRPPDKLPEPDDFVSQQCPTPHGSIPDGFNQVVKRGEFTGQHVIEAMKCMNFMAVKSGCVLCDDLHALMRYCSVDRLPMALDYDMTWNKIWEYLVIKHSSADGHQVNCCLTCRLPDVVFLLRNNSVYARHVEDNSGDDQGAALPPAMVVDRRTAVRQLAPRLPGGYFYSDDPDDVIKIVDEILRRQNLCNDNDAATGQIGVVSSGLRSQILIENGSRLEGFQFVATRVLGSGSFGQVCEIQDFNHNEQRFSRLPYCQKNIAIQKFFPDEVRMVFHLAHDNLVPIYGVGLDCGTVHVLMECVQGTNLIKYVEMLSKCSGRRYSGLGQYYVILFAKQLVSVLAYLEEKKIIHNDIKGLNILISPHRKQVKLADFGLAETSPAKRKFRGTNDYLAPEKFDTCGCYDTKVDVFGLGLTMVMAVTGYPRPYFYFYREHRDAQMNAFTIPSHCTSGENLSDIKDRGLVPELVDFFKQCLSHVEDRKFASQLREHVVFQLLDLSPNDERFRVGDDYEPPALSEGSSSSLSDPVSSGNAPWGPRKILRELEQQQEVDVEMDAGHQASPLDHLSVNTVNFSGVTQPSSSTRVAVPSVLRDMVEEMEFDVDTELGEDPLLG